MDTRHLEAQIAGIAALEEPARRALYLFVAGQPGEVSRDQAAAAVGSSRGLAGFHLDKLVEEGLLDTSFRRLTGRTGPGAGRPAKLYRRSARQLDLSLPARSYELAARILASAIDASGSPETRAALDTAAESIGRSLGEELRTQETPAGSATTPVAAVSAAMERGGYEPEVEGSEIRLRNCPFHALIGEHKALVCGMNLALARGMVAGLGVEGITPRLAPTEGHCCVCLTASP
jgi:predicted ArsR family transcriptional regulator